MASAASVDSAAAAGSTAEPYVFYSGEGAQEAAAQYVAENGGTMLNLTNASPEEIIAASEAFAQSASGNVLVFQKASVLSTNSIFGTVEYPALIGNPNVSGLTIKLLNP